MMRFALAICAGLGHCRDDTGRCGSAAVGEGYEAPRLTPNRWPAPSRSMMQPIGTLADARKKVGADIIPNQVFVLPGLGA